MENSSIDPIPDECLSEMRRQDQTTTTLSTTAGQVEGASIVTIEHFSSLRRLLRVVAWVYCFVRRLRFPETREDEGLLAKDVEKAHNFLIRVEQVALRQNTKFRLWRRQFGLFEDKQGVLRCGGRLSNAGIPCETANPIFLEKRSYLTHLIVKDCHERMKHGGVSSTLAELRSKYWVVQGQQLTKQVIYHCILCRRFQGKSYKAPPPPPLPLMRVDEKPPFTYTGVDFAGPLYTRETLAATSRKVWLCLYTCCVTRAVHIELVTEMKATAFLRSFKRFTARRGVPVKMLSDNGKTFKAADKWIATVMKHPSVCSYWTENRISWRFNVEKAPWWGGVFERMIQSMKRLLRKMIGTAKLTFDELMTAVIEVEGLLNSRPLTYMSCDELIEPITPSHLLCGRRIATLPDHPTEDEDEYVPGNENTGDKITRRMKHLNQVMEGLWTRWRKEYLLELRNSHRSSRQPGDKQLQVGVDDVVIIEDEKVPRGFWRLGTITKLLVGKDEMVRAAVVRTHNKEGKPVELRRPVLKLYPLEIHGSTPRPPPVDLQTDIPEPVAVEPAASNSTVRTRPKRKAALRARERIASWAKDLKSDND